MPDVTVNHLRFNVQTLGDPSGTPVVMAHGMLTGNVASWYFGLAPVVARDHFVFLYDQRGHGRSERPASGYTLTQLADDMDRVTDGLGPCTVVGHSYGGVVALRHAIDHPGRVTSLVLVESFVPSAPSTNDDPVAEVVTGSATEPGSGRAWRPARRPSTPGAPASGDRRHRARAEQALLEDTTILRDLRDDSTLDPAGLADLDVPVLCAVGADSPFRGDVEALADRLPAERRRVHVLPGGHALHLDAADPLADLVTGFLDQNDQANVGSRV
jgi:pimeloyl-ACP methyl ester carboxylesterase